MNMAAHAGDAARQRHPPVIAAIQRQCRPADEPLHAGREIQHGVPGQEEHREHRRNHVEMAERRPSSAMDEGDGDGEPRVVGGAEPAAEHPRSTPSFASACNVRGAPSSAPMALDKRAADTPTSMGDPHLAIAVMSESPSSVPVGTRRKRKTGMAMYTASPLRQRPAGCRAGARAPDPAGRPTSRCPPRSR